MEIQLLARMVTEPYEKLLRIAASVRAQEVPAGFDEAFELFAQWIGEPIPRFGSS